MEKVTYSCERCGKVVTVYHSQYKKSKRHLAKGPNFGRKGGDAK